MSFEILTDRRKTLRILAVGIGAGIAASCGYSPVYGPRSTSQVAAALSGVRVGPIKDRTGQILRNNLLDRLNPKGQPTSPEYHLSVTVKESIRNLGIQRDETSTRSDLTLSASFQLVKLGINEPVMRGKSSSTNGFNRVNTHYATVVAARDARKRAASEIADDIANRLAAYLKRVEGS